MRFLPCRSDRLQTRVQICTLPRCAFVKRSPLVLSSTIPRCLLVRGEHLRSCRHAPQRERADPLSIPRLPPASFAVIPPPCGSPYFGKRNVIWKISCVV